jgi:hypothetical protein
MVSLSFTSFLLIKIKFNGNESKSSKSYERPQRGHANPSRLPQEG